MAIRKVIGSLMRRLAAQEGLTVLRAANRFGIDPFVDVGRLAGLMGLSLDNVFDVGANDGDTAIRAFADFPGKPVTSFEPHPQTFARLRDRVGPQAGFTAVNAALGAEVATLELIEYGDDKTNSLASNAQFAVRYGQERGRVSVECQTLDAYCARAGIERIGLLKIDTEGFDLEVLHGARALLERKAISFVYVEFNELQPREGVHGGALLPIDSFLRPFGYQFFSSYLDYARTDGGLFTVSNALFVAVS